MIDDLDPVQVRILGALLEKEQTTPEYYPLTVNALLAACNQKSNRDPVMAVTEAQLWDELEALRVEVLVWRSEGARAERWSQSISRRLELDPEEKALLTVLMLRGAQTVGELRSRSRRLHAFDTAADVRAALNRLAAEERELVVELSRRPGQKESRWTHCLGGPVESAARPPRLDRPTAEAVSTPGAHDLSERVAALEGRVEELRSLVERLRQRLEP